MTKILTILLLISISLNGTTRSLAKLELACSMGNKDACLKISGHTKPKKNLIQTNNTTKANPSIKNDAVSVPTESSSNSKSPNTYNSLGKELAFFKEDCIIYENATLLPRKIRNTCKKYITDVDKAFKLGYQLDKYNDSDTISEKQLGRYLKMLRNADEERENLITTIKKEVANARTNNNAKYYNQLILGNHIRLKAKDYAFMMQYPDDMKDNPKYIKYVSMLEQKKRDEQARKKAEELKKKKARVERHKKILAKAQLDLARQTSEAKQNKTRKISNNKHKQSSKQNIEQKSSLNKLVDNRNTPNKKDGLKYFNLGNSVAENDEDVENAIITVKTGKRMEYAGNQPTAIYYWQTCNTSERVSDYRGEHIKVKSRPYMAIASATFDYLGSKKNKELTYTVSCILTAKQIKNIIVKKKYLIEDIYKVVEKKCSYIPQKICRPQAPLETFEFIRKLQQYQSRIDKTKK